MVKPLRLIVSPDSASGKFIARLEGSDVLIVEGTRQPLVDGARVLLAHDFDPAAPLTMPAAALGSTTVRMVRALRLPSA